MASNDLADVERMPRRAEVRWSWSDLAGVEWRGLLGLGVELRSALAGGTCQGYNVTAGRSGLGG